MKKSIFFILCLMVIGIGIAFAGKPGNTIIDYEKSAALVSVGTCDNLRTVLLRFKHGHGEMIRVDPVSRNRFYVIRGNDGKEKFFIERLGRKGRVIEQMANAMEWSAELMLESPNYFRYHFFRDAPSKQSDCTESPAPSRK